MYTYLLIFTGLSMYISLYKITHDKLNPQSIFLLVWYIAASIASEPSLYVSFLQVEWNSEMKLVIFLSGVSFFIPSILLAKKKQDVLRDKIHFSRVFYLLFNSLMLFAVLAFLLRYSQNEFQITLFFEASDIKSSIPDAIPFINYFELMIPFLSLTAFFELQMSLTLSRNRKRILYTYIIFSLIIYSLLYSVSRGAIILFLLGAIYFYNRKYDISWKQISLIMIMLIVGMTAFSFIRIGIESAVFTSFGNGLLRALFSSFYTYIAFNFENLHQLIVADIAMSEGWYTWKMLLKPFFYQEYESNTLDLKQFDTLYFNARTYLYPFYHDLHFLGILIYPFMMGVVISLIVKASNKNALYVLMLMAMQKALFFTMFGNYFFGDLVILFPYVMLMVLIKSNKMVYGRIR